MPYRAFELVDQTIRRWIDAGEIPAYSYTVGNRAGTIRTNQIGSQSPYRDGPLRDDALFLIASPTKPLTVLAALMLVERGLVVLDDKVREFVPEFLRHGKGEVTLRHLMTHTSGLCDMLPENDRLRAEHKPLSAFVEATCNSELLFPAGTEVRYQSMGTLLLAQVVEQVDGRPLARFLDEELFQPLGLRDTWLGAPAHVLDRIAEIALMPGQERTNWHWNSPYWRSLGAPWGGLISTAADFGRICRMFLNDGSIDGERIVSPTTVRAMSRSALEGFPNLPEADRRCRPWGLGWRMNWGGQSAHFGDLLSPRAYGHWGATGTLCWIDPELDAYAVFFTTRPASSEGRYLARASNMIVTGLSGS